MPESVPNAAKICFVVQGFGEKTDLSTGRTLNLDASYGVIKEAVQAAGLTCVRLDEAASGFSIDRPFYEYLLNADLVIVDLSTGNLNAAFGLGICHGLRPHGTIVVAEEGFKPPFLLDHLVIRRYEHLGEDLGLAEAMRFREELTRTVRSMVESRAVDSPVYEFLRLDPVTRDSAATPAPRADEELDQRARELLSVAGSLLDRGDFAAATEILRSLNARRPEDASIIRQLARATVQSNLPTPAAAADEARGLMQVLSPESSNDSATTVLWGAVHARLWELQSDRTALDVSIKSYRRGFELKRDPENGIGYAFVLNIRAAIQEERAEAVADAVTATRVRREVVRLAELAWSRGSAIEERFQTAAILWEANVGLDRSAEEARWREALRTAPERLRVATEARIGQLTPLLATARSRSYDPPAPAA